MLKEIYYRLHHLISEPQERGEYSAGHWAAIVRREVLLSCGGNKGKILEVGCGEGLFLAQLADKNHELEIWGIDNSSTRIKQARIRLEAGNIHLAVEDAARLSFPDEYFDVVVCINVFFNLPSKEAVRDVLSQMKRVCKKTGLLVFDFRNAANFLLRLKYSLAPLYDGTVKNLPLKTYYQGEIEALVRGLGLRLLQKRYLGAPWKMLAPIILIQAEKS